MRTRTAGPEISFVPSHRTFLTDDSIDAERLYADINNGKKRRRMYIITLSEKEGELFEIYQAKELIKPIYSNRTFRVCGIGRGRQKTIDMLGRMLLCCTKKDGTIDVDSIFAS